MQARCFMTAVVHSAIMTSHARQRPAFVLTSERSRRFIVQSPVVSINLPHVVRTAGHGACKLPHDDGRTPGSEDDRNIKKHETEWCGGGWGVVGFCMGEKMWLSGFHHHLILIFLQYYFTVVVSRL